MDNNFNNTVSSDFLRVLLTLKANIMKDSNNVDVCQITKKIDGEYLGTSLTTQSILTLDCIEGITINVNDYAVVIFADRDYRTNLSRMRRGLIPIYQDNQTLHSRSYGIIIGKLA